MYGVHLLQEIRIFFRISFVVHIIILILHLSVTSVCESGRSREAIRPEQKTFLSKGRRARIRSKSRLTCCDLVTVNELDSRVAVVHGCFSEGGDSILSVFSWEPLRAKLQHN